MGLTSSKNVEQVQQNSQTLQYANEVKHNLLKNKDVIMERIAQDFETNGTTFANDTIKREIIERAFEDLLNIASASTGSISNLIKTKFPKTSEFFSSYIAPNLRKLSVAGACECSLYRPRLGGEDLDELATYLNSENSKTKKQLINNMFDVFAKMKLVDAAASDKEKMDKLRTLVSAKKLSSRSTEELRTIVKELTKVINNTLGTELIPTTISPEVAIKLIAELVNSMSTSLHVELITIRNNVETTLNNMMHLKELLLDNQKLLTENIKKNPQNTDVELALRKDVNDMLLNELERQVKLLQGMLHLPLKQFEKIDSLIRKQSELGQTIDSLDIANQSQFAKVIYNAIMGMGMTVHLATMIDEALKKLGIKAEEYVKMRNSNEIKTKLGEIIQNPNLSDAERKMYVDAGQLLLDKFNLKDEYNNVREGSAEDFDENQFISSHIADQINDSKKVRNAIFTAFSTKINRIFESFVDALINMTKYIGEGIPISTELDGFRRTVGRLNEEFVARKKIYESLIGYYNDAHSVQVKHDFVGKLKDVLKELDILLASPLYSPSQQYFLPIKSALETLIKTIDSYTEQIAAKFGRAEFPAPKTGSGVFDEEPNYVLKSTKTIEKALRNFDYMYKAAQIVYNLQNTASEMKEYSKDYEQMTAKSIADIMTEETKKYEEIRKAIEEYTKDIETKPDKGGNNQPPSKDDIAARKKEIDAQLKLLKYQFDTKIKFWRTVEAIDMYMQEFTDKIVNNPRDVATIRTLISGSEIVSDWYSEITGQYLANVFEKLKSGDDAIKVTTSGEEKHYYEDIKEKADNVYDADDEPNVPATKVEESKTELDKALSEWFIFKNIMTILSYIDKTYMKDVKQKLSPTAIYKNLLEYIKASAYSHGTETFKLKDGKLDFGTDEYDVEPLNFSLSTISNSKGFMNFDRENEIFVQLIKSMTAKIFTLMGMHDMLKRPFEPNSLTPLRMMLGGIDYVVETPKVDENIVELYVRLLLLAQFYKNLFSYNKDNDEIYKNNFSDYGGFKDRSICLKITMVPDVNGVFSGLIKHVFRKTEDLNNDMYTDNDIKIIVREINLIYQRMQSKYPENTVRKTIDEFVNEINRRYGILTKEERNAYENTFGYKYDYASEDVNHNRYNTNPDRDIPILPDEELDVDEVQPLSEAEKLVPQLSETTKKERISRKFTIHKDHYKLVRAFRCIIDKHFQDKDSEFSFTDAITVAKEKLRNESDDNKRINIVAELIRGSGLYDKTNALKYLLFHETVVAGLNVLSIIHSLLSKFKRRILAINVGELIRVIKKMSDYQDANNNNPHNMESIMKELYNNILAGVTDDTPESAKMLFSNIIGKNSSERGEWHVKKVNGAIDNNIAKLDLFKLRNGDNHELFERYFFDYEFIMKELLESIFAITTDSQELVKFGFSGDTISINWSNLKQEIITMFDNIKYFIDLFRGSFPELVDKYTKKTNAGSYYWLQEQIVEKILEGRPKQKYVDHPKPEYVSLEKLTVIINDIFKRLTRKWRVHGIRAGVGGAPHTALLDQNDKFNYNTYDKVFAELIFYNAEKPQSGLVTSSLASHIGDDGWPDENAKVSDILGKYHPFELLHFYSKIPRNVEHPDTKVIDTRYIARYKQLYTWSEELTFNRSLLYSFNQLIARVVQNIFDPTTQTVYNKLIEPFAFNAFGNAIKNLEDTYPDTVPTFITKYLPQPRTGQYEGGYQKDEIMAALDQNHANYYNTAIDNEGTAIDLTAGSENTIPLRNNNATIVTGNDKIYFNYLDDTNQTNTLSFNEENFTQFITELGQIYTDIKGLTKQGNNWDNKGMMVNFFSDSKNILGLLSSVTQGNDIVKELIFAIRGAGSARINTPQARQNNHPTYYRRYAEILQLVNNVDEQINYINTKSPQQILRLLNNGEIIRYNSKTNDYFLNIPGLPELNVIGNNKTLVKYVKIGHYKVMTYSDFESIIKDPKVSQENKDTIVMLIMLQTFMNDNDLIYNPGNLDHADINNKRGTLTLKNEKHNSVVLDMYKINKKLYGPILANIFAKENIISRISVPSITKTTEYNKAKQTPPLRDEDMIISHDSLIKYIENGDSLLISEESVGEQLGNHPFSNRYDPDKDHVLFTSLAVLIRNMVSVTRPQVQDREYIRTDLSQIPQYMKDRLILALPVLENMFRFVAKKSDFLKLFLNHRNMYVERYWIETNAPTENPWPGKLQSAGGNGIDNSLNSNQVKLRFTGILETIKTGSVTLMNSFDTVYNELGDDPKYLEFVKNGIDTYKMMNGVEPLMPMSTTLHLFDNVTKETESAILPSYKDSVDKQKLIFAVRNILNKPNKLPALNPAWTSIVQGYNMTTRSADKTDDAISSKYITSFINLTKFAYENIRVKGLLTPYVVEVRNPNTKLNTKEILRTGVFIREPLIIDNEELLSNNPRDNDNIVESIRADGIVNPNNKSTVSLSKFKHEKLDRVISPVYQLTHTTAEVIDLTESSFKDNKLKEIGEHLISDKNLSKESLEVQNILDLNIVPINVHALRREIPLVNIYNYAYTFDRLLVDLLYGGHGNANARKIIKELCEVSNENREQFIRNSKDALVQLMLDPYMIVNNSYAQVEGMMIGRSGDGLGRPKFINDQIYGKVLFGNAYVSKGSYSEIGPIESRNVGTLTQSEGLLNELARLRSKLPDLALPQSSQYQIKANSIAKTLLTIPGLAANVQNVINDLANIANIHDITKAHVDDIIAHKDLIINKIINLSDISKDVANKFKNNDKYSLKKGVANNKLLDAADNQLTDLLGTILHRYNWLVKHLYLFDVEIEQIINFFVAIVSLPNQQDNDSVFPQYYKQHYNAGNFNNLNNNNFLETIKAHATALKINDLGFDTIVALLKANLDNNNPLLNEILLNLRAFLSHVYDRYEDDANNKDNKDHNNKTIDKYNKDIKNSLRKVMLGYQAGKLTYLARGNDLEGYGATLGSNDNQVHNSNQVKEIYLTGENIVKLSNVGKQRFDTVLIRNLIFITNLNRIIRLKISNDLAYNRDVIVDSEAITAPELTEFYGNSIYTPRFVRR